MEMDNASDAIRADLFFKKASRWFCRLFSKNRTMAGLYIRRRNIIALGHGNPFSAPFHCP
jgi:hypothetical protein